MSHLVENEALDSKIVESNST